MGLVVKDTGSNFEMPSPGIHQAVCIGYFDIGLQPGFGNGAPKEKVIVMFELDQRLTKGDFAGQRFLQSKEYTQSLGDKANLRKDLESWRGHAFTEEQLQGFDMDNIIGKNCMLNLVHAISATGKERMDITAIMKPMEGYTPMVRELPADHVFTWIEDKKKNALPKAPALAANEVGHGAGVSDKDIPF